MLTRLRLPYRDAGVVALRERQPATAVKRGNSRSDQLEQVFHPAAAAAFLRSLSLLVLIQVSAFRVWMPSSLAHYEAFLVNNVSVISTLESSLRSITWILPGRFKDAELASEARQLSSLIVHAVC